MTLKAGHPDELLLRYVEGTLSDAERRKIDEHLTACKACREQLAFAEKLRRGLSELPGEELTTDEPCPDSWTLVSYEAGTVDEETARHLRTHLLFCDQCAGEFQALRCASREESWRDLLERLKGAVIDLARSYGPGALVGSVRIVAEQPVPAMRGGNEISQAISKVLEVSLDKNTYSIELRLTPGGLVACDIAGIQTRSKTPLSITVHSGAGEELNSMKSDKFGNAHFAVPVASLPDGLIMLTITLDGSESQLLFRLPETQQSA